MDFDISQLVESISIGMGVWFFAYGMNRVYLWVKGMVS